MPTFPSPDIAAALARPTITTVDPDTGYAFDTTSPEWKAACAPLPSFAGVKWPGYATACFPQTINGMEAIVQPWLGQCQQFMGRSNFPGGVGGEVGVYVKVPGGRPLPDLQLLPVPVRAMLELADATDPDNLWWPHPDVQPEIEFTIVNPLDDSELLHADAETNYWVNKWMEPDSYAKYVASCGGRVPQWHDAYQMFFTVDGVSREWTGTPVMGG